VELSAPIGHPHSRNPNKQTDTMAADTSVPPWAAPSPEPSERVASAITRFAEAANLDPAHVIAGGGFEMNGRGMWLCHFGQRDPNAVVLALDMGEYPEAEPEPFLRMALEHNMTTPAAVHGYYALLRGTRQLAFCIRVDLANVPDGAMALAALITSLVEGMENIQKILESHLDSKSKDPSTNFA
jgi:hypothetical protein